MKKQHNEYDGSKTIVVIIHEGHSTTCILGPNEKLVINGNCPEDPEFVDSIGGGHSGGTGTNPNGEFCGECTVGDCSKCPVWAETTEKAKTNNKEES